MKTNIIYGLLGSAICVEDHDNLAQFYLPKDELFYEELTNFKVDKTDKLEYQNDDIIVRMETAPENKIRIEIECKGAKLISSINEKEFDRLADKALKLRKHLD